MTEQGPAASRREGLPRVAAAVAVTAWALVAASAALLLGARPAAEEDLWFYAVDVVVGGVYGTVAAVILARRRHAVPWILAVTGVGGGVAAFGYAWGALAERLGGLPLDAQLAQLNGIAWVPGTLALFLVVPWLVREGPPDAAGRAGIALGVAVTLAFTAYRVLVLDPLHTWVSSAVVAAGLVTAADVLRRRATGTSAERPGLGWLAAGTAVMALSFVPIAFYDALAWPVWVTPALHVAAQAVFPAAILAAVLRQRMWGLELAVGRATLAGALTTLLVVLYAAVAAVLGRLLPDAPGAAGLLAAAAVAVAVQPSRLWLGRRVQRLVYGEGAEPDRALRRLGGQLGQAGSADELLGGLVESVGRALRLESAVLRVDGVRAAAWGAPTSAAVAVPLERGGRTLGTLEVTAPPGESLDARSLRTLGELAAVVTSGVVLARASQELTEARERLTSVRLEERRVIRRELHDGLGPSLAGLRLGLQAARNLVGPDPEGAAALLGSLQAELEGRVDDVRTLSRSLLPPILDELGLGPALDELAARRREGGPELVVRHAGTELLDARVAAAAYGITVEALTNVARHAAASRCVVSVLAAGDELVVTVDDDGRGVRADAPAGVGTRSMRERAVEQGGTLRIAALEPRGTRVEARLPLGELP